MNRYIPENLNLDSSKHKDKYYFIIAFISVGRIFDKRKNSESYIELSSSFLKKIINGRYKDYIQDLIGMEIIETDNQYFVKRKFKAYRLREKYRNSKLKQVQIIDEKILTNYEVYKQSNKPINSPHSYLYDCLTQTQIDYEPAKYFVNQTVTDFEKYVCSNCSIDMIHSKDWFFVVDSTAGRVHNNITNLSKNIRPFLRYENKKLIEIDISNSQPLLFNILIDSFLNSYSTVSNFLPYVPHSDLTQYKKLTEDGKIYDYLMEKYDSKENRDEFKVRFFSKVFYSKENVNYVYEEREKFKSLFPNVAKIISSYKKDNYKDLAIRLQKIEAEIMINKIVPELEKKKIFALTIHDSILVLPKHEKVVKKIIMDEFQKYGLRPTLKTKNYNINIKQVML